MKNTQLSEKEIYTIVDREISTNELEAHCKKEAEKDSLGNFDLMISRYLLIRVEDLREQKNLSCNKSKALEQRKIEAVKQIVNERRWRGSPIKNGVKKSRGFPFSLFFGNVILAVSVTGAALAFSILLGDTIYSASYPMLGAIAVAVMLLPLALSKVKLGRIKIPYQPTLMSLCVFMCVSSAATGLILMKTDPPSYTQAKSNDLNSESTPLSVNLKPAINQPAVVGNP